MKSEKEKMLAGEWFYPMDEELTQDRDRATLLMHRLNVEYSIRDQIYLDTLKELCPDAQGLIRAPFYCDYGYNIHIGEGTFVNFDCTFLDLGPIRIGRNSLIGPKVQLLTACHPMEADLRASGIESGRGITIGDNCWLGGGVIVCPGITIGDGAVIGAGAVVTRDVPAGAVAAGNPARILRKP